MIHTNFASRLHAFLLSIALGLSFSPGVFFGALQAEASSQPGTGKSGAEQSANQNKSANQSTKKQAALSKPDSGKKVGQARPIEVPVYKPTEAEITAAEKRIALKQTTAELVVAYKYQLRSSVPYLMRKLKALAPESAELRYFEALQLYEKGERGRALIQLKDAIYRAPHFSRAWNLQGIIFSEADRLPEARGAFEQAIVHNPYNPNYVYNLASVMYRMGDIVGAQAVAQRSIKLKANLSEGYYLQGRIHRDQKNFGQALLAFQKANQYGQTSPDFLLDYLLVAEAAGDEKAVPDLADRLSGARDSGTLRELARIHGKFGEYKEATIYLARLMALPEAKTRDRKQYVYALHKSKKNVKLAIQRIPKIKPVEREALFQYQQELEAGDRTKPGTRDPMLKPIK